MTLARARTLTNRYWWPGITVLFGAGVSGTLGFDQFTIPLLVLGSFLIWRASYWDGWTQALKRAEGAQK